MTLIASSSSAMGEVAPEVMEYVDVEGLIRVDCASDPPGLVMGVSSAASFTAGYGNALTFVFKFTLGFLILVAMISYNMNVLEFNFCPDD